MAVGDVLTGVNLALKHGFQIDLDGEKPSSLIHLAEVALSITFPPSYKEFLLNFGCGDISGQEFYGLITDDFINSGIPDAVWITMRERSDSHLPSKLIIVGARGDGPYYVLDCRYPDRDGECPVILWWPGASRLDYTESYETVASDFGTFFLDKIKSLL